MANPYAPPVLDLGSQIANLGNVYYGAQDAARKRQVEMDRVAKLQQIAQQYPGQLPPPAALGAALLSVGDVSGAMTAATLAQSQADKDWTKKYQTATLGLQQEALNKPQVVGSAETGYKVIRPRELATGAAADAASGGGFIIPPKAKEPSSDDKKAIREATDKRLQLLNTLKGLERAEELNPKTLSGPLASSRARAGEYLPDVLVPDALADPASSRATIEWESIMNPEAIGAMSSALSGPTTNFELQQFQKQLADPATPIDVRKRIITRMKEMAQSQLAESEARIKDIRGGTYYKPEGTPGVADPAAAPPAAPQYVEGKRYRSKSTGKTFVIRNGQPVEE